MSESTMLAVEWLVFSVATSLFSFGLGATLAVTGFSLQVLLGGLSWATVVPILIGTVFATVWLRLLIRRTSALNRPHDAGLE